MDQRNDSIAGDRPCWAERIAIGTAGFAVLMGVSVLLGWTFGIEWLKRVLPTLVAMNPATALCFIGLGAALLLCRNPQASATAKRSARLITVVVLAVGSIRLVMYIFGVDAGIDQLLFPNALDSDASGVPNRMAPNTAALFVALALALYFVDHTTKRGWRPTEWLAIATSITALIATLGYFFGVGSLYQVKFFIPMAVNTSTTFLLLSVGVLMARPKEGALATITSDLAGGLLARRLILGALTITIVLSLLRLEGETAGLFELQFGVALMTSMTIVMLIAYFWFLARAMNNIDAARKAVESRLRAAHHELQEQHDLMKTILASMGEGIAVADLDEHFVLFNPAAQAITGRTPTQEGSTAWSKHFGVFKPDRTTPFPVDELALKVALRGESVDDQEQFLRNEQSPDGRYVSVSARPLRKPDGEVRGGLVVFRDITERKKLEQRLLAFNAELERRVEERTQELARSVAQLQQFAYVASHDLQEPLRMVTSYLQLIDRRYRDKLDDTAREFINYAVDGATRMKQLIVDLLEYSRVESRAGKFTKVDLAKLLMDVTRVLEPVIKETGAQITFGELPEIVADATQLRQLFQNLVANSLKFRGEDAPRVEIAAERDGEGWQFSVRDNGIGLDPEHGERIFEMFQRLHSRDAYPGTGIGLAICKKIVERHGGRIWVESAPGVGATFYFTVAKQEVTRDAQQAAA